ncbi:ABC transporter ATP-binding protein [Flavobacterium sp.]|uniref:ABC transporter ATP-binding protein n=1 Tax=Flavobacterium sp. TaxID=239 RepID=UPI002FDD5D6D
MKTFIKNIVHKNSVSFRYFYSYLGYRVFLYSSLSVLVGFLDGLGLAMFLPLLQMVDSNQVTSAHQESKLGFVTKAMESMGISVTLTSVLILMTLFFVLKGFLFFIQSRYGVRILQYFINTIRKNNLVRLNKVDFKYFIKSDIGKIQNTLTGETERLGMSYASYFLTLQQGVMVIVYVGFAFFVDAKFALLVGVGGVMINYVFRSIYPKTKQASQELTKKNNELQGLLIQHVANYKYLKATGLLQEYSVKLNQKIDEIKIVGRRIGTLVAILKGTREPLLIIVVSLVIVIQVNFFNSALGPILISLLFFYRALTSVVATQTAWNNFLVNSGSMENLKSFEKELQENQQKESHTEAFSFTDSIALKQVAVHIDQARILSDIQLKIEKNKTTAFVGESGSGKSTLLNVFSGLLAVSEGTIEIDGRPIASLQNLNFQKKIGYITQEVVIFNDTLYNNVTLWATKTEANLNLFYKAITEASLVAFVASYPEKEQVLLGNNGVNLSGGQRQRVSIARELFKQPELLLLDEATSALDSETEQAIMASINKLKGRLTILTVAHRLSTIKEADKVVFVSGGRIQNVGTFEELIINEPEFKRMVQLQEL